ncbi:MAG: ribonuclease HII [Lachnospiraceae bacterium]|nr:ribonuclease HII [Lachnospiraceae bacterium]
MIQIGMIEQELKTATEKELSFFIKKYQDDERRSVQKLVQRATKQIEAYEKECVRTKQLWKYEEDYAQYSHICGIDEVGRGPFAGPVVAAAVILPKNSNLLYINDSKKLSEKKREELFEEIQKEAVAIGIGCVGPQIIDQINILQATYEAMRQAVGNLCIEPDLLLNDAVVIPGLPMKQVPIIKGDAKSISIGAASIIAKVTRDRMMEQYEILFPEYGFSSNKGYGTKEHIEAIKENGMTPIHRRSFIHF